MNECLFCQIAEEKVPSSKVYSDEHTYAFLDISPVNPGHTILIPRKHSRNLFDIREESLSQLAVTLKKISVAVKDGVGGNGINIHVNNEPAAGQVIFHTHFHIIPRFTDDKLRLWRGREYKEGEMEQVAQKIKSQF